MTDSKDTAGVRFPPPLIFVGTFLLGLALDRFLPWTVRGIPQWLTIGISLLLGLAGILLLFRSLGLFAKAGNNPEPWKPVDQFIAEGIYLRTRNPMYLGMALLYLALTAFFHSIGAVLLFPLLIWMIGHFVIAREESYLERQFGESYLKYKGKVRRWM